MKIFGIVVCVLCMTLGASAVEYPEFRSAVSTTGITANFESVYSQAETLHMVYDIVDHDEKGIVYKYKDTGNWGILKDDGTVAIASTSAFSLDVKDVLNADLVRAKNLVIASGGSTSDAPLVYYVDNPYLYRVIAYDFNSNFDLNLFIPNCTVEGAILSVAGSDYADYYSDVDKGQRYYIDGEEVSGCDAVPCRSGAQISMWLSAGGISCIPSECAMRDTMYVSVAPVDITGKILPGIHRIAALSINDQHTMTIEAVTSISDDEMLLYSDDYTIMIAETRSLPMTALYELIEPIEQAYNATFKTPATNSTQ